MTSYAVVIERASDGGYRLATGLPGVAALGGTKAGTLDEMRKAAEFHLDGLRDGPPIPQPSTMAATVITPARPDKPGVIGGGHPDGC